jgi:uncharacterized protein with NRDE domain
MCLITFAYQSHPKYTLILAGNRDEFYARPTREAQFWGAEGEPDILAGKDLKAGGTWLGINQDGRWGALTNYRDFNIQKQDPPSRGELVLDYLKSNNDGEIYLQKLLPTADHYNGFNLLLGDENGLYHMLNQEQEIQTIKPGIHGLSNASLNTPWLKVKKAKERLKEIINQPEIKKEDLFNLLLDEDKAPDGTLPATGLSGEMEKAVSSIFIKTENYGSRCSTLLLIDKEGNIDFTERRFKPGTTEMKGEQHFNFEIT